MNKYLKLDFFKRMDNVGNTHAKEIYSKSLKEQYEMLKKRIPIDRKMENLEEFLIKLLKPGLLGDFFIAAPNFNSEAKQGPGELQYYNNVVIWPKHTQKMNEILPNKRSVLLIGDIMWNPNGQNFMIIKAMDLFPSDIQGLGEKKLEGFYPVLRITSHEWLGQNSHNDCFTSQFMKEYVIDNSVTNKPEQFRNILNAWETYLSFENALLDEKLNNHYSISDISFLGHTHAMPKHLYRKNKEKNRQLLLDGLNEKVFNGYYILEENVEESEPFPLIKVVHIINKKDIPKETNKRKNYLSKLHAFTKDNVAISKEFDRTKNGNNSKTIPLGGRHLKIFKQEISPDLSGIEKEKSKAIKEYENAWKFKVANETDQALEKSLTLYKKTLEKKHHALLENYRATLPKLDNIYALNDLPKVIQAQLDREWEKLKKQKKKTKDTLKKSFNKSKNHSNHEKHQKSLDQKLRSIEQDFEAEKSELYSNENINKLLAEYVKKAIHDKKNTLDQTLKNELQNKKKDERLKIYEKIKNTYQEKYDQEIKAIEKDYKNKVQNEIKNNTVVAFTIYFKLHSNDGELSNKLLKNYKYLVFSDIAERAKIRRQQDALSNLKNGNMRNPFIASYLTASKHLDYKSIDQEILTFHLETLNEKQKESIQKIMASKGIFLLQGPPGTGKTQVIAEAVSQLTMQNKKVIVASETHKAIDNVFDRLPPNPGIRPLRLIANDKRDTGYEVKFLVDNLYDKMQKMMRGFKNRYETTKQSLDSFKGYYDELVLMINKLESMQDKNLTDEQKINELKAEKRNHYFKIKSLNDDISRLSRYKEQLSTMTLSLVNYYDDFDDLKVLNEFKEKGKALIKNSQWLDISNANSFDEVFKDLLEYDFSELSKTIHWVIDHLEETQTYLKLKAERETLEPFKKEPKNRKRMKAIRQKLRAFDRHHTLNILTVFNMDALTKKTFLNAFDAFITEMLSFEEAFKEGLKNEIEAIDMEREDKVDEIEEIQHEYDKLSKRINKLDRNDELSKIQSMQMKIDKKIATLFNNWNIHKSYENYKGALKIIKETYQEKYKEFKSDSLMKESHIKIFDKVAEYLEDSELREADRKIYTNTLFEQVNLIGITCTSRDAFDDTHLGDFKKYNIETLNLKEAGIDVVIIDEVSKSSFLELLIPLQYGQQIILVGDHRQLSPFYQHRHMKAEDFEQFDSEILNLKTNTKLAHLYEDSYFKQLFMDLKGPFKNMLERQYRSHTQIMNVFNHFYDGKLKIGYNHQDQDKQHKVHYSIRGIDYITPKTSAYLIDNATYESLEEGETSITNEGEKGVVLKLLDIIDNAYKKDTSKVSVGVITTYGNQAAKIKNSIKNTVKNGKYSSFSKAREERFIVNTVDEFQGDERDIIIVSMVRNPKKRHRANSSFIKQFERINVAFSRARKLLIIVGSREYLSEYGKINLPNLDGDSQKDKKHYPVYEKIFQTISEHDGIINADILMKGELF